MLLFVFFNLLDIRGGKTTKLINNLILRFVIPLSPILPSRRKKEGSKCTFVVLSKTQKRNNIPNIINLRGTMCD